MAAEGEDGDANTASTPLNDTEINILKSYVGCPYIIHSSMINSSYLVVNIIQLWVLYFRSLFIIEL